MFELPVSVFKQTVTSGINEPKEMIKGCISSMVFQQRDGIHSTELYWGTAKEIIVLRMPSKGWEVVAYAINPST